MKYLVITTAIFFSLIITSASAQNESLAEATLQQHHQKIRSTMDSIYKRMAACSDSLKMKISDETRTRIYREYIYLHQLPKEDKKKELQIDFEFIRNNPSSKLCLTLLSQRMLNKEYSDMYDTFYHYFTILPDEEKNSVKGRMLTQDFSDWKNSAIGSHAKDFSAKDIDKNEVTLSSYKGNSYVLLDFWGSHCGPCRYGMPYLKELYGKYHTKGLEIIGISIDANFDSWQQAIKQDGTGIWRQVCQKQNNANIFKEFYVQAMPVKILINKEGIIIGRWYGDSEENNTDLAQKLTDAF